MAVGGLALRGSSSFIRALQFLCAALILGIFSYFLARRFSNWNNIAFRLIHAQISTEIIKVFRNGKRLWKGYLGPLSSTLPLPSSSLASWEGSLSSAPWAYSLIFFFWVVLSLSLFSEGEEFAAVRALRTLSSESDTKKLASLRRQYLLSPS